MPVSHRAHTVHFWSLIHGLLHDAEAQGIYTSPFDAVEEFAELTRRIEEKFLGVNGELMKVLGRLLIQAQKLRAKRRAGEALRSGMSPDRVKEALKELPPREDPASRLKEERKRGDGAPRGAERRSQRRMRCPL